MNEQVTESDHTRTTVAEAIAAWEEKGPTSLTVSLLADALYGARDALASVNAKVDHWLAQGQRIKDQEARAFTNAHALELVEALSQHRTPSGSTTAATPEEDA